MLEGLRYRARIVFIDVVAACVDAAHLVAMAMEKRLSAPIPMHQPGVSLLKTRKITNFVLRRVGRKGAGHQQPLDQRRAIAAKQGIGSVQLAHDNCGECERQKNGHCISQNE